MALATIDLTALGAAISPEIPSGENLEYDPDFLALERAAQGKPERQKGETTEPAEPPDWRLVSKGALGLLERTKDLRLYAHLLRAQIHLNGFAGLADALAAVRDALEQHWDSVHPALTEEDAYDPTARVNIIASLAHPGTVVRPVRGLPLVESRTHGAFSALDIALASGQEPPLPDTEPPDPAAIEGAFLEAAIDDLSAVSETIAAAAGHAAAIEAFVTDKVGAAQAPSLAPLLEVLREAERALAPRLAGRQSGDQAPAGRTNGAAGDAWPAERGQANGAGGSAAVNGRDDVVRLIDRICAYYDRHEPSSPVPLLLKRARRLVSMNFMEVLQDIAPDAAESAERVIGSMRTE